jgi:uncharacterized protein YdaU (DUF1376 family)
MKFHVGDYLADTMHLTTFQHGIYLMLIFHCFKHHGDLPLDERELARIARVPVPQWRRYSPPVMALFRREKHAWRHTRIDAEIVSREKLSETRQSAGRSGAYKKWGMANANGQDGKSTSPARPRARDSTEPETESPPNPPASGGTRGRARMNGGGRKPSRNGMVDLILDEMEAEADAEANDARPEGPRVVSIVGRLNRRGDDP